MIVSLRHLFGWLVSAFRSREDLVLENLALRRQLLALHTQQPRRRLTAQHKLFWVALRTFWSGWIKPLIMGVDTELRLYSSIGWCRRHKDLRRFPEVQNLGTGRNFEELRVGVSENDVRDLEILNAKSRILPLADEVDAKLR